MMFLPELIAALVILLAGYMIGKIAGSIVRNFIERQGIDGRVRRTPLGRGMESDRGVAIGLGKVVKWFVYALAVLAAASVLEITILSQWISAAITYIPALIAGILIIIFGFVLADFIGDMIARTEALTRTGYTGLISEGVKMFLYFIVLVIGLDTIGVDVTILYILGRAVAWGLAIGIGLAVGIGLGWGSKEYVQDNIENWMERAREHTSE